MVSWSEHLRFALHLADLADEISLPHFHEHPATRTKPDGTLVTEADEAVERTIRGEIRAAYPGAAILGEEEGPAAAIRDGEGPEQRWIIDPIDGTHNYAWGVPVWGTLIALESDGELVLGVASAPALGERYEAARGMGARRNGETMRVSEVDALGESRLTFNSLPVFEARGYGGGFASLSRAVGATRGFGDFWGHMLVANGSMDIMAEPIVAVWDLAPLLVIVEEAGGRFTDLDGHPRADGGSALSTNGVLHDEVLGFFRTPDG